MAMYETSDLHKRVARYEAALDELRAAHQDVRHVLVDQVLYERWQQIGAELGFAAPATVQGVEQQSRQMSEAWAG
ncbi:hypothetical protein ODJ79_19185 [Actinoplanes sp. KI2]|uniref:hypothetical protein n=1 Tax=Actinoplanes sp. KI2 TaxID=2983315 RepID=UPI0021D5D752|nr:hypothetical protein [Actinoplanes sp. KI2]MCU7725859.1 hypothetical protein [Actinoplanes sp. KI2]